MNKHSIGQIGNYYGDLKVTAKDGKFFWAIPNYDRTDWEEIPQSLYEALINFNSLPEQPFPAFDDDDDED